MASPQIEIPGLSPTESGELVDQIGALWSIATPAADIARAVKLPRKLVDRIINTLAGGEQRAGTTREGNTFNEHI
jgi:hypothetical protein